MPAAVLAAAVAAAALYAPVIAGLVRQWYEDSATSHGILLVAAAAVVLRRSWPTLRRLPAQPSNAGAAMLALALGIFIMGSLTGDAFVLRVSLPCAIAGCLLFVGGRTWLRATLAPLALFAIAIPLPAVIETYLTMPLQLIASRVAASSLDAVQIDVVRDGNLLHLQNISLEVAEACSGLRSLTSLVAVSAVAAAVLSLSVPRTALLIAAAIPIAVFGNGLRVAATGVLATWIGEAAVNGFLHDLTGYVAFGVMCLAVVAVHLAVRWLTAHRGRAVEPAVASS
jgi:exosortase